MNYFIQILPIIFSLIVLLSVIWIIFPAPSYYVWLYSVVVSEWSLWFGGLALFAIFSASVGYIFYKNGTILSVSIIIGGIGFLISLYPFFSSISAARENGVSLSFGQYFSAVFGNKSDANPFQTRVYERDFKVDIYLPKDKNLRQGASLIVVHGGSWSGGERNDFPQWNQWFSDNGFAVFDIDYTLVQPNYDAAVGDVKSAVRWIKNHAAEFEISPDKIVLLGRSAGGHLALISAYSADNEEKVCAVISIYAPTNLTWAFDNPANTFVIDGKKTLSNFLGGSPHESDELRKRYLSASPTENINAQTPPTLLFHGGKDQLVRLENMYFVTEKLNASNVTNHTVYIPYGQHGFDYNSNGWGSQITKSVMLKFLAENTQKK